MAERRDAADRERLDVIGAEEQMMTSGFGLVEDLAELVHRAAGLLELLRVLVRRTREHKSAIVSTKFNFCS